MEEDVVRLRLVLAMLLFAAILGIGVASADGTVTPRVELHTVVVGADGVPMPGPVVACGGSVSGEGEVLVDEYATATLAKQYQFRSGYGVNGGTESWYGNGYETIPGGAETFIGSQVQDIDPGVTSVTFTLNAVGYTRSSCAIHTSNIPSAGEGLKSVRPQITGGLVDQVRIVASEYATNAPITCGDTTTPHLSRVQWDIQMLSSVGRFASYHTHIESPDKSGPDQDGNPANNRWWERTIPQQKWIPANQWTTVATFVSATNPGINVIHAGEISADGQKVETFCSWRN